MSPEAGYNGRENKEKRGKVEGKVNRALLRPLHAPTPKRIPDKSELTTASFGSHADSEQETANQQLLPSLSAGAANDGPEAELGREEDGTSTAEVEVQGVRKPTSDDTMSTQV
jgi:hypothetical protein